MVRVYHSNPSLVVLSFNGITEVPDTSDVNGSSLIQSIGLNLAFWDQNYSQNTLTGMSLNVCSRPNLRSLSFKPVLYLNSSFIVDVGIGNGMVSGSVSCWISTDSILDS